MPVDVSSYPTAQSQQGMDPLSQLGKIFQIQGAQTQLAMQQQEFKARQALGPILQQSIDPQSGELDINKFLINGAANPDAAWKMPEITLQMIQRQNVQADTVIKQLEANKVRYGAMGDAAGSLVSAAEENASKKVNLQTGGPGIPGISNKELAGALSNMVGENGLIDAKDAAEIITKTAGMTDQQRFDYAKRFATSALGVKDTMDKTYGAIQAHGYGGGTAFTRPNSLAGTNPQVGTLTNTPTPAEMNSPTTVVDKRGVPSIQPRVAVAPMVTGSGAQVPGSGQNPQPTGLAPQEQALQTERAKTANDYESGLNDANTTGQENLRVLREMQDAMKQFKTGGGMEVRQRLAQLAQGVGMPQKLVDDLAGGNRGAVAEFQKLAVRYATQEMKTNMGQAQKFTNLDFSTFLKNNPTIDTDPRGLEKMFGFLEKGVWRMQQQQEYYNRWKQGERPKDFSGAGMDAFPAFWTRVLAKANEPAKSPAGAP
jgi:hypothetical protein